ncbi:RHS repeat domain-containing protein [Dictyobacter kobayashii]|uniref:Teneurin-like YD-shell domain-containing protein n=1 Tax=Dictyobacter kobayashii TaxID=2014872 RepID=A0A402AWS3_9CHLR|nr:RHS repeat-associated core domain-containing protein [Dictyobacter kobayashii]GCE23591.1 hypothetical protein KDK_73910 [Dictyobacter kobayashii]
MASQAVPECRDEWHLCNAIWPIPSASKVYYYLFNGQGSIVGMTDSAGNLVASYDDDPLGSISGSNVQSGIVNPWQYAGGYYDSNTGLTKFGIRYYDPIFGRWTQRAPVGGTLQETLKANPYVYADNDPVNEIDPNGQAACHLSDIKEHDYLGGWVRNFSLGAGCTQLITDLPVVGAFLKPETDLSNTSTLAVSTSPIYLLSLPPTLAFIIPDNFSLFQ